MLVTEDGRELLDFTSGQMSAILGHPHPHPESDEVNGTAALSKGAWAAQVRR